MDPECPLYFREIGAGSPLLLIHGLMISGDMFEPVLAPLAARHRLIIPDLRGHGRSRGLPPPYTVAQMADDLAGLLRFLKIDSTAVLGYSQGGAVAQQFALSHPGRCACLTLVCAYAYNMVSFREKIEGHLVPTFVRVLGMRRFAELILAIGLRHISKETADRVVRLVGDQDRDRMIASWNSAMSFDSRPRLSEIKCPTLVVAGSSDTAVPLHHAAMLNSGIAGSRLSVFEGAGHDLIWERPSALAQAVNEFVA